MREVNEDNQNKGIGEDSMSSQKHLDKSIAVGIFLEFFTNSLEKTAWMQIST
jgi:hypothetical protein